MYLFSRLTAFVGGGLKRGRLQENYQIDFNELTLTRRGVQVNDRALVFQVDGLCREVDFDKEACASELQN